ncbi:MAG: NAD-dependent protein deacetylase [Myxococcales bacterium]|nr:NAD-dependent protein deacetylase [Myxococcales bacterium]
MSNDALDRAAAAIAAAPALIFSAGAGMGVDSGLPDFRGDEGFWKAYPPFRKLGYSFVQMANGAWFHRDLPLAWGFYGHRLMLYRRTAPHAGFAILQRLAARAGRSFVFTSNVDGHFHRSDFADTRIVECHGSLNTLQCLRDCGADLWPADTVTVDVDEATLRARAPLPKCPICGGPARPNVLMFNDFEWNPTRTTAQEARLEAWLADLRQRRLAPVIIECGAGTAVPSVRRFSELTVRRLGGTLIRINPREPEGPPGTIALPMGALAALTAIEARLS